MSAAGADAFSPRTCSHPSGLISPPGRCRQRCLILSLETHPQQLHHTSLLVTRRSVLGNTTPLISRDGWAVLLRPGITQAPAGSLPTYPCPEPPFPEPPCPSLFLCVRGIPGAGKTQPLTVPHDQRRGLCIMGWLMFPVTWAWSFSLAVALPMASSHVMPMASRQEKTNGSEREKSQERYVIGSYFLVFFPEFFISG